MPTSARGTAPTLLAQGPPLQACLVPQMSLFHSKLFCFRIWALLFSWTTVISLNFPSTASCLEDPSSPVTPAEPSSDRRPWPLPSVLLPSHSLRSCPCSFWPPLHTESKPHGVGGCASPASCSGGEKFGAAGLVCVSLSVTGITRGHWGERSR